MFNLCFHAEKRSLDPDAITFAKWQAICDAFKVDHCYVIDDVGFPFKLRGLNSPRTIVNSFDEVPGPYVFVEKNAPLNRTPVAYPDFIYPDDVTYCFGSDAQGMPYAWHEQETSIEGDWIYIPIDSSLWADQAAAVILTDRKLRGDSR